MIQRKHSVCPSMSPYNLIWLMVKLTVWFFGKKIRVFVCPIWDYSIICLHNALSWTLYWLLLCLRWFDRQFCRPLWFTYSNIRLVSSWALLVFLFFHITMHWKSYYKAFVIALPWNLVTQKYFTYFSLLIRKRLLPLHHWIKTPDIMVLTKNEIDLIETIRNYRRAFPNGKKNLEIYILDLVYSLMEEDTEE